MKIITEKNRLIVIVLFLIGGMLIVFPSITNSIIENLLGILLGILILIGALFAPFYLMTLNKNKNGTNKNDQEANGHNTNKSDGGTFFGGDFGGGDGGSGGGGSCSSYDLYDGASLRSGRRPAHRLRTRTCPSPHGDACLRRPPPPHPKAKKPSEVTPALDFISFKIQKTFQG